MRIPIVLLIQLILILTTISCNEQNNNEPCSLIIDQVEILDTKSIANKTYFLVYRIAGWSDKVEILELYDHKPVFDQCARSHSEPVYSDSLEMSKTVSHVFLNDKQGKLNIVYMEEQTPNNQKNHLKLELK